MNAEKTKAIAAYAAKLIGAAIASWVLIQLGIEFLWACYYAGIPM